MLGGEGRQDVSRRAGAQEQRSVARPRHPCRIARLVTQVVPTAGPRPVAAPGARGAFVDRSRGRSPGRALQRRESAESPSGEASARRTGAGSRYRYIATYPRASAHRSRRWLTRMIGVDHVPRPAGPRATTGAGGAIPCATGDRRLPRTVDDQSRGGTTGAPAQTRRGSRITVIQVLRSSGRPDSNRRRPAWEGDRSTAPCSATERYSNWLRPVHHGCRTVDPDRKTDLVDPRWTRRLPASV